MTNDEERTASERPERTPSRAQQMRQLLPRWPSDLVVALLLGFGAAGFIVTGGQDSSGWFLLPGVVAAIVQKLNGHWAAWHSDGVERAYVLESSALCFYLLAAGLLGAGVLQGVGVVRHVNLAWGALGALFLDTLVRDWAKNRYV